MAGRPRKYNEEEIIQKAENIFWEKGYESTSSEDLLKAMNIGKSSFYLLFKGGKEELFIRTIEERSRKTQTKLRKKFNASTNKLESLKELFYERLETQEFYKNYGCYLGNTIVEMANINESVKRLAAIHLQKMENLFLEVIEECIENRKLKTAHSSEFIAHMLINLWNGMNITKRMGNDTKQMKEVIRYSLKILD